MTVSVLWLFLTVPWVGVQCIIFVEFVVFSDHYHMLLGVLTVPWVGLQCVIVVIPDHTHSLTIIYTKKIVFVFKELT